MQHACNLLGDVQNPYMLHETCMYIKWKHACYMHVVRCMYLMIFHVACMLHVQYFKQGFSYSIYPLFYSWDKIFTDFGDFKISTTSMSHR